MSNEKKDKEPQTSNVKSPEVEEKVRKKEIEFFTSELAKKINRASTVRTRQSRIKRMLGVSPIVTVLSVFLIFFLFAGLFNRSITSQTVSITEVLNQVKGNNVSQIIIQNDGSVKAKGKTYLVTSEKLELDAEESVLTKISSESNKSNFEEAQFEDVLEMLSPKDLFTRLRESFSTANVSIKEIVFGEDFSLVITNNLNANNLVIKGVDKATFSRLLSNEGLSLSELGFPTSELKIFGRDATAESLQKKLGNDLVTDVIELEGITIARLSESAVVTWNIDWSQNIFTFTDLLQQEGFALSSSNQTYEVVSSNIPAGITLDTILTLVTIVGFVFLGFIIFRSAQASGMGVMQFGQSKAKMFFGQKTEVSFKDVAGIDEAREELNEIVDFLRHPNKFRKLGARIPKGILMFGPPGTGKTLLARAIAGEAGVPFFHTSGSEFEEMLVGAGASRVRDLFDKAKKAAPALIFIDEIDAVARKRGTRIQSGTTEQTLNQILVEMDGFEKNTNVIVIAATNRPDVLDNAILRPGRFDRQVRIELPDKDGRLAILKIHTKNKPLSKDVDLEKVAKRTVGFTGADLENIMNEAAIVAAKAEKSEVTMSHIEEAVEKVLLGPAKRSRKRTEKELKLVAYHEAGHALIARYTEGAIPVDKISIVSRGDSGGVTMFLPDKDENIVSRTRLIADIKVSLGGRAAEEVALDDISTGASSDIEKATSVVRRMIQKFGMSEALGMVQYGQSMDNQYLGYHYGDTKDFSEKTAEIIDNEVRKIIKDSYDYDIKLLKDKRKELDKLANLLLEKEVLDKEDFDKVFPKDK